MTPFIIPQVLLIKSLIREIYSRGTARRGFLIIVDEFNVLYACVRVCARACEKGEHLSVTQVYGSGYLY